MLSEFFFSLLIGLIVGLLSSVLGLGGGLAIVPLLPLVAKVSARETIGTSLLAVFFVALVNVWKFHQKGHVSWSVGLAIGVCAACGAFFAATATGYVPTFFLHALMGLVLVLVGVFTLFPKAFKGGFRLPNQTTVQRSVSAAVIGLASGLVSGFTGIGGGILITPLLARLKSVAAASVVPTANLAIVLTALSGTSALMRAGFTDSVGSRFGHVRLDLALALFLGAQITATFGRKHQHRLDPRNRDWLIGTLLLVLAVKTWLAALHSLS